MKALFLVFHGFAAHNGISKKIFSQVDALRACGMETDLCYLQRGKDGSWQRMVGQTVVEDFGRGIRGKIGKRANYASLADYIRREGIEFVYMRSDHNANPFLSCFLARIRKMGVKVAMEIPTYPYDQEYSRSPLKRRASLWADKVFRRRMARNIDRIVTFADVPQIFGIPTVRISNGIDFDKISLRIPDGQEFGKLRLLGVADVHFWHGFDRVVEGLSRYYRGEVPVQVEFHIVGGGVPALMEELREQVKRCGLEGKVVFHGPLWGADLDRMFDRADLGIASLGRHRSGIDKIKTLKNREYAARGIPFVYSETDNDFDAKPYVMKVPADESPVDIAALVDFRGSAHFAPQQIRDTVAGLSWQVQMGRVIEGIFGVQTVIQ